MIKKYTIENKSKNEFVSDLLGDFLHILEEREGISALSISRNPCSNSKTISEIILSFTISFSAGLAIELLKYCISKSKNRPDYDKDYIIGINEVEYTLEEIEEK